MSFEHLKQKLGDCDFVFYKVMSNNDKSWSWDKDAPGYSHQGGILIPAEVLSVMFPKEEADKGIGPDFIPARTPRDTGYYAIDMLYDDNGVWKKFYEGTADTRRTKFGKSYEDRDEYRVTAGLNKDMFKASAPRAIIVIARDAKARSAGRYVYYYDIYDPDDDDYLAFLDYFEFSTGFDYQFIDIAKVAVPTAEELRELVETYRPMTVLEEEQKTNQLAKMTWERHMASKGISDLNDIFIGESKPGNLLQDLWKLGHEVLKEVQKQICPFDIMALLVTEAGKPSLDIDDLMRIIADHFEEIRRMFVSINSSVSSIAGKAFEKHIELCLYANSIPYEPQVKLDDKKIPDFTLPSKQFYYLPDDVRNLDDAMLLSAKTTLRERWSQILLEGKRVKTRYLLTLDKGVSSDLLKAMKDKEVELVVTESDKKEFYDTADNAIPFPVLFEVIKDKRKSCKDKGFEWLPPTGFVPWWLR